MTSDNEPPHPTAPAPRANTSNEKGFKRPLQYPAITCAWGKQCQRSFSRVRLAMLKTLDRVFEIVVRLEIVCSAAVVCDSIPPMA